MAHSLMCASTHPHRFHSAKAGDLLIIAIITIKMCLLQCLRRFTGLQNFEHFRDDDDVDQLVISDGDSYGDG